MLTIITEDYEININLKYILDSISLREDEDWSMRSSDQIYDWVIDNLYREEMVDDEVVTYKHRIHGDWPELQMYDNHKKNDARLVY